MTEIQLIEEMLLETAQIVQEKYAVRSSIKVSSKNEPNDLLTEADLAVQDRVCERIAQVFPSDAIAAEERERAHNPDDPGARCWVIDPIDGTQNFVFGIFPIFGISIAFAVGGRPVAGGIMFPINNDIFLAERGAGTRRNGKPQRVSEITRVDTARIEIDFSGREHRKETLERAGAIIEEAGQIRCNGSTVHGLCSIASADMEAFFHVALNPWDYAAGQIIIEEAGGKTSRLDGAPLMLFDNKKGILASNAHIHNQLLKMIKPIV